MQLTRRQLTNLYVAVFAATHGALVSGKQQRGKALLAANEAKQHALAAVRVAKENGRKR